MAFTQARAIALINAALSFHNAVIKARNYAQNLDYDIAQGNITASNPYEVAFKDILFYLSESNIQLFHDYATSFNTLTTEHAHFSRAVSRNIRQAERQRERRAARTAIQGPTRPYNQYIMPYETERLPHTITHAPQGMNKRGDLPQAYKDNLLKEGDQPPPLTEKGLDLLKAEMDRLRAQQDEHDEGFNKALESWGSEPVEDEPEPE